LPIENGRNDDEHNDASSAEAVKKRGVNNDVQKGSQEAAGENTEGRP